MWNKFIVKEKGTRKGTRGNFNCLNYKQQS